VQIFSLVLIPISLAPSLTGLSGTIYFWGGFDFRARALFCKPYIHTFKISD